MVEFEFAFASHSLIHFGYTAGVGFGGEVKSGSFFDVADGAVVVVLAKEHVLTAVGSLFEGLHLFRLRGDN